MKAASPCRILVLRGGAIGDFVLTVPVLDALRRVWPAARLTLVAQPRLGRLAADCGLADLPVSLDSTAVSRLYTPHAGDGPPLDPLLRADLVVCLLRDTDGVVRANFALAGCARVLYRDPVPVAGHAADYLAGVLDPLGITPPPPCVPRLHRLASACPTPTFVSGRRRPVVCLHPGSGSARKNWPPEHFAALARQLAEDDHCTPLFVLGEADAQAAEALARLAPRVARLPPCDLSRLASELADADAYIGNDAGITHLAASLGVPTVALFGPSNPAVWAPRGHHVRVLTPSPATADLSRLRVQAVHDALVAILRARRPQGFYGPWQGSGAEINERL